jgi:hypothetical protein
MDVTRFGGEGVGGYFQTSFSIFSLKLFRIPKVLTFSYFDFFSSIFYRLTFYFRYFSFDLFTFDLSWGNQKINSNTLFQFLFPMFTENNIYNTFSLHFRIAIQHQISFAYFCMTSVIYVTVVTIAFVRQFIFFMRDVFTRSVF